MAKAIIFLPDGMADNRLDKLNNKTPLEYANTPGMDSIAKAGVNGTFRTLIDGFPTSSDVANMSVLGYDPAECYPGRGPIEAVSQGIKLGPQDIAWRCNLVNVTREGIMNDYSSGHLAEDVAEVLMNDLQKEFGSDLVTFYSGVSYRNLLVLHGEQFSDKVTYAKPDSSHGEHIDDLVWTALDQDDVKAQFTVDFIKDLCEKAAKFLADHSLNKKLKVTANRIWPWSPGYQPDFKPFLEKYDGKKGAVISAVDVVKGIGLCAKMEVIEVAGATGFIDTNYAGKAAAALEAIKRNDLVYLHVEAIDECSHLGDLDLKIKAINDFDSQIVIPVMKGICEMFKNGELDCDINFAVLPDHPVPIQLRKHTRTPVPLAICGPNFTPDGVDVYSEIEALNGSLGLLGGEDLVRTLIFEKKQTICGDGCADCGGSC
ncbi:cofactor-independent phosphoglycerate mutase [Lentisphaerota bacterium WC36G]|nr:cofactor-independent phosphoglycerate mutase [Lentisphaerae bacterium WC36]